MGGEPVTGKPLLLRGTSEQNPAHANGIPPARVLNPWCAHLRAWETDDPTSAAHRGQAARALLTPPPAPSGPRGSAHPQSHSGHQRGPLPIFPVTREAVKNLWEASSQVRRWKRACGETPPRQALAFSHTNPPRARKQSAFNSTLQSRWFFRTTNFNGTSMNYWKNITVFWKIS